jgi:hypothetical protein
VRVGRPADAPSCGAELAGGRHDRVGARTVAPVIERRLKEDPDIAETPRVTNGATPATKVCRTCGIEKPANEFARNRGICKPCRREQNHAWEAERVERRREQGAAPDDEEGPLPATLAADEEP